MKRYLDSCQTEFWKEVFEKELAYLLGKLEGCRNVLSVGCGPAIIEKGLLEYGFEVTGLDVSMEALQGSPDTIRKVVGRAEKMDAFKDESFNAVIFIASLQFVDDFASAIQESWRVLKPKGKFVVMLLNPESAFYRKKREEPDSYINKIKHPALKPIETGISHHFSIVATEYFLGIRDKEIFESSDPKWAALYIIEGVKSFK